VTLINTGYFDYYHPPKDYGGEGFCFGFVCLKPFRLTSFRPSPFSVRTHNLVMDFQILFSFYRNMYLHMRTAHTRFGCTDQLEIQLWPFVTFKYT